MASRTRMDPDRERTGGPSLYCPRCALESANVQEDRGLPRGQGTRFTGPAWNSPWRLSGEWADWLARPEWGWTHFETFTFAEPCLSARTALRRVEAHYRRLGERCSLGARGFAVVEGSNRVRMHVHALSVLRWKGPRAHLDSPGMVSLEVHKTAHREWFERWGRCRISPVSGDTIGASFYLAKYLTKGEDPDRWAFLPWSAWKLRMPSC